MLCLVSLVALLVQFYSLGYLHDEPPPALGRYYAYQSLFAFSMMGLVLAPNLLQLFMCWELVGLCSYLLIGFWYQQAGGRARRGEGVLDHEGRRRRLADRHRACCSALTGTFDFTELALAGREQRAPARRPRDHHVLHLPGRDGQVGPVPAARVAARRDGRPDAGLRADPRGDDGDGGRVPAGADRLAVRADAGRAARSSPGSARSRRCSPRCSPACRTTSSACSRTRPSRSSAT